MNGAGEEDGAPYLCPTDVAVSSGCVQLQVANWRLSSFSTSESRTQIEITGLLKYFQEAVKRSLHFVRGLTGERHRCCPFEGFG